MAYLLPLPFAEYKSKCSPLIHFLLIANEQQKLLYLRKSARSNHEEESLTNGYSGRPTSSVPVVIIHYTEKEMTILLCLSKIVLTN